MSQEMLLEIGTEELPTSYIPLALESLGTAAEVGLKEARISFKGTETYGTPRRLVLRVTGLSEKQDDLVQEQQGPAKAIAFDAQGHPTKAAEGFAIGRGVSIEDLMVRETPKGEYVFARVVTPGRHTVEILSQLLPDTIRDLSFLKSMRWGTGALRFARPIRWLLALLGSQVIPFSLEGLPSGNQTFGHRQLSPGPFRVASASLYWKAMAKAEIMVDQRERRKTIWEGLQKAAAAEGGHPLLDEDLLETVTYLVECPTALCGRFDQSYLSLPREVLTTALSEHQKYFAVVDDKDRLLPLFLAVSNGDSQRGQLILKGHQKVLVARLEDAKFFFQEDLKAPLADKVDMLKQVVFQEDLGTLYDKTERIGALADHLSEVLSLSHAQRRASSRAALLCKADLITHMVGEKEFSKLQGYMGQQYALVSGESEVAAQAIFEHYLPRFAEDLLPQSLPGSVVAIADKVDTIVGCFGVGFIPTGSHDPYALRRGALGVIRILLQHKLHLDLHGLVDRALDLLAEKLKKERAGVREEILTFFRQRMESQLVEAELDPDVVDAVLSIADRDVVDALGRGQALQSFRTREEFQTLVQTSKRVANILRGQAVSGSPDPSLFRDEAERKLLQAAQTAHKKVSKSLQTEAYDRALEGTLALVEPINAFFERILVMEKDQDLRKNRLRLMAEVREGFMVVADYSKIVIRGEGSSANLV
jgi:glycyl-tRNA synthetase beta chain